METSLRYGGDSKSLRIHAKEKIPISTNAVCQLSGELDTRIGAPTFLNAMIRYYYPDFSASGGAGVLYNRNGKVHYNLRGKATFPVTADKVLNFNVKGRCVVDDQFRKTSYSGATELVWYIPDVKANQDLRLKFGYDVVDKIPYFQIQENNWTFNADGNKRWNVRYNL